VNQDQPDDAGFLKLIAANRPRLLRLCRVYAWTPADQEDLYQEILVQIWRSLPALRQQSFASTWLYRVAINTAISFVRKQKRGARIVSADNAQLHRWADVQADSNPSAPDPRIAQLYEALDTLTKVEKAVMTLFLEDLTYDEMAEALGLGASHVGVILHRAKKKISAVIAEASL